MFGLRESCANETSISGGATHSSEALLGRLLLLHHGRASDAERRVTCFPLRVVVVAPSCRTNADIKREVTLRSLLADRASWARRKANRVRHSPSVGLSVSSSGQSPIVSRGVPRIGRAKLRRLERKLPQTLARYAVGQWGAHTCARDTLAAAGTRRANPPRWPSPSNTRSHSRRR
jgi:hypothetical protein